MKKLLCIFALLVTLLLSLSACKVQGSGEDECEHTSLSEWKTEKAASCTEAGEKSRHCLVEGCDYTEKDTIPKLGHDIFNYPKVDATCEAEGSTAYETCSRCDYATTPTVIEKLPHTPSAWITDTASTCHTKGSKHKECQICKEVLETIEIDMTKHSYGSYITTTEPTCTAEGTKTKYCENDGCDAEISTSIEALGHDMDAGVVTANPTCTEAGVKTFSCQREGCNHTKTEAVGALGHSGENIIVDVYPTCTESGLQHGVCDVCGETLDNDVIPALGHDMDAFVETAAPTCTEDGVSTSTCKNGCGHTETKPIPEIGHDMGAFVETSAPTCTEDGVSTSNCKNGCGHTETKPIPEIGHDMGAFVETAAPTCTKDGVSTSTCKNGCGHTETKPIAKTGHDMGAFVETAAPTCAEDGVKTSTCKNGCGHTETEPIARLKHVIGVWKSTESGTRERKCNGCDYKETDYVINFDNGKLVSNDRITFTPGKLTSDGVNAGESAPDAITSGMASGGNTNTKLEIRDNVQSKIRGFVLYITNFPAKESFFEHTSATLGLTSDSDGGDFFVLEFDYIGMTRTNSGAEPMFRITFGGDDNNPLDFYPKYGKDKNYGEGMNFGIGKRNILNSEYTYNAETDTSTVLPHDEWVTVRLVLEAPKNGADSDYKLYTYVKSSTTKNNLTLVSTTTASGTEILANGVSKSSNAALNVSTLKSAALDSVKINFYNSSKPYLSDTFEYAIDNISFMRLDSLECPHTEISDWSVTLEPTANTAGRKVRRCLSDDCEYFETVEIPANLIFDKYVDKLVLIYADKKLNSDLKQELYDLIYDTVGVRLQLENEVPEIAAEHEIIIGKSERAASKKAYELLDALMAGKDESFGGYVVYSDGASIAAAYTEEYTEHIKEFLFDYLLTLCGTGELAIPRGTVKQECINLYEIYAREDAEHREQEWAAFEAEMGTEITEAFKYLYGMYSSDVVEWLANLYEPRVCVCDNYDENGIRICLFPKDDEGNYICKNGGFYYSNSGKKTYGYGIDIESTLQALGIIDSAGLTYKFGGSYLNILPAQIQADIVAFLKSCQGENGFFYHPQWSREAVDAQLGRRGRDLMWAESLLKKFGAKPFYDTPNGTKGEGAPGSIVSPVALTSRLGSSAIVAAARVVSVSESVAEHLVSAESFKAYLDTLSLNTYSYSVGNQLAAQSTQLVARDKQLNGAISEVLFEWYNNHQNPENGLWEPQINHSSVNGLFKILTVYNDFKEPFPYAYEAACASIQVISSDEKPAHVCSLYNAWWNVGALLKNMELYNTSYTKEQRDEIRSSVLEIAAQGLYDTRDWYEVFAKESGSFSYTPEYASATSQGMPVALPKTAEGDVNATTICLNGLRNHAVYALGASVTPELFGTLEMVKFLHIIENATPTVKVDIPDAVALDFEEDDVGTMPERVGGNVADAETGLLKSGGYALISSAPGNRTGKVLHITHLKNPGNGDDLVISNIGRTRNTNCTILDTDMYVAKDSTSLKAPIAQLTVGRAYMLFMQTTSDGRLELWEGSALTIGKSKDRRIATLNMDEWFNLRVEYYPGTKDTVRIKLYLNDVLLLVSENYMDSNGTKFTEDTPAPVDIGEYFRFIGHSSYNMNFYLDNLYIGCQSKTYESEADTEGLIANADKTGGERITYTFGGSSLPTDMSVSGKEGKFTVSGGALKLNSVSGSATLTLPTNVREGMGNVYSLGFDMQLTSAPSLGDTLSVTFNVPYAQYGIKSIMKITFKVMELNGALALVPTNNDGTEVFTSAAILLGGKSVSLEFALFKDSSRALIYADGVLAGSTEYFDMILTYKPYHYDFSSVSFVYDGKIAASIDNLYAEVRLGSLAE